MEKDTALSSDSIKDISKSKSNSLRQSIKESVQKNISKQNRGVNSILETGKNCDVDSMTVKLKKQVEGSIGVYINKAHVGIHGKYSEESEINVNYNKYDE